MSFIKFKTNITSSISFQLLLGFIFLAPGINAQQHGLAFSGNEVVSDKRTSLVLGHEKPICLDGNFSLKFDLRLKTNIENHFGYIFRIIDQQNRNVDLIYKGQLQLVYGEQKIDLDFDFENEEAFQKWNEIVFHFEEASFGSKSMAKKSVGLVKRASGLVWIALEFILGLVIIKAYKPGM